ncbi:MAG: extracellular solute-binding protein [Devosia sp.]|nr:extracellular solute-binding protein [Devosia sp.]
MSLLDKRWLTLIGAASAVAMLSASAMAQDKITVTFANWASAEGTTRDALEKIIADFEAANPNIDIVSETISFSEIARQLVLRARSGNPPDVAQIAGNDTILLAGTGTLEPLDAYPSDQLKANIKPGALSTLTVDGKLIAFPWNQSPAGLWYNKEILKAAGLDPENPPKTIPEITAALEAIHASQPDVIPLGMDTTNRAFALTSNWPWMRVFGAVPVGEGATGANSPEMRAYLTWMRDLAQKGLIEPGRKIGEFRPLAAQGKVAFHWDQVLLQGVIQGTNGMSNEDFYSTWGVTTLPIGPNGTAHTFEGGHQLIMFGNSANKEAAWSFIEYLSTDAAAVDGYTVGVLSSLPSIVATGDPEVDAKLDTPIFNAFSTRVIPTLSPQPYGAEYAAAATAIMAGVQEAVTGNQPIDEIAASMQQQLDK